MTFNQVETRVNYFGFPDLCSVSKRITGIVLLPSLLLGSPAFATEEETTARIYRSPEERREAGLGRELTDWLSVSGLLELETEYWRDKSSEGNRTTQLRDSSQTLQLGLEAAFTDEMTADLVFEYEFERQKALVDEFVVEYDNGHWSLALGRQTVSFGEYYSHFVTGPMLEIGETQADALEFGVQISSSFDAFIFGFEGEAGETDGENNAIDYGIGFEYVSNNESIKAGVSWLSDLAESSEGIVSDEGNRYKHRVDALNGYLLWAAESYELTAEFVTAQKSFAELDANANKPSAWNLELAWMQTPTWQLALRMEGSEELEGELKRQYGISSAWLVGRYLHLSLDYLYGRFQSGFVTDDDDEDPLSSHQSVAFQLSVEF